MLKTKFNHIIFGCALVATSLNAGAQFDFGKKLKEAVDEVVEEKSDNATPNMPSTPNTKNAGSGNINRSGSSGGEVDCSSMGIGVVSAATLAVNNERGTTHLKTPDGVCKQPLNGLAVDDTPGFVREVVPYTDGRKSGVACAYHSRRPHNLNAQMPFESNVMSGVTIQFKENGFVEGFACLKNGRQVQNEDCQNLPVLEQVPGGLSLHEPEKVLRCPKYGQDVKQDAFDISTLRL